MMIFILIHYNLNLIKFYWYQFKRNILLTSENKIKITDFNASRIIDSDNMLSSNVGTLLYMSHEMLNHEEYGPKTDIWSAGCILYELITLKRYFDNSNDSIDNLKTKNIFKILLKK